MNEKFNKNAKVEKFTTMMGIAVSLIVIDPFELSSTDPSGLIDRGKGRNPNYSYRGIISGTNMFLTTIQTVIYNRWAKNSLTDLYVNSKYRDPVFIIIGILNIFSTDTLKIKLNRWRKNLDK